jgi:hypothetical protein
MRSLVVARSDRRNDERRTVALEQCNSCRRTVSSSRDRRASRSKSADCHRPKFSHPFSFSIISSAVTFRPPSYISFAKSRQSHVNGKALRWSGAAERKTTLSGAEIHDQVETDSTRLDQIGTVVLLLYINRNA